MKKLNSIIVTTYNHAQFIAQCIESILSQNVDDLEIIIVDDGSKDSTPSICREYSNQGVCLYRKKNGGPSSALNFGIDRAQGSNIFIMSGDDRLLPGSIDARALALSYQGVDFVTSVPFWINGQGRRLTSDEHQPVFYNPGPLSSMQLFKRLLYEGNFICAPSVAFTRNFRSAVGQFNELLMQLQDYEYWLRAAALGFTIHILDSPLIEYRIHHKNLSTSNPARLEWELDFVMSNAPSLLSQPDVQHLLFGEGFRSTNLGIKQKLLIPFVNIGNPRQSVSSIGQWQLGKMIEDTKTLKLLSKKL